MESPISPCTLSSERSVRRYGKKWLEKFHHGFLVSLLVENKLGAVTLRTAIKYIHLLDFARILRTQGVDDNNTMVTQRNMQAEADLKQKVECDGTPAHFTRYK